MDVTENQLEFGGDAKRVDDVSCCLHWKQMGEISQNQVHDYCSATNAIFTTPITTTLPIVNLC